MQIGEIQREEDLRRRQAPQMHAEKRAPARADSLYAREKSVRKPCTRKQKKREGAL